MPSDKDPDADDPGPDTELTLMNREDHVFHCS